MSAERLITIASLVATILLAVIAWLQYTKKKERVQVQPDPLKIRNVKANAKEDDCKERYKLCMEAITRSAAENTKEHARLYDQIDVVERRAEDRLNQSLDKVNETVRKLPAEVLTMLRTTGQLKDHR